MDFSVVIPAHNEEKYIEETLDSIPKDIEITVVCNACTDSTEKIAKKHAKVISLKEANVSKARNEGAKNSKGEILIFLDADTKIYSKNFFEEIKKTLNNSVVGTCKSAPDSKSLKAKLAIKFKNLFLWAGWSSGIIFCKKEIFEKVQGFNESLTKKEDSNFIKKCLKYGKFGVADCFVITSMRRYEKYGYIKLALYWTKETIFKNKKPYPVIR